METRIIIIGIALALIFGAGAGYTLSPKMTTSPELENQLEEQQATIQTLQRDSLETKTILTTTQNENTELQNLLGEAKVFFESIETELDELEGGFGVPDYDSGWTPIDTGEKISLAHRLGTSDDLFVYMIGRYYGSEVNQLYYGLCYWGQYQVGCGWSMDDTNVYVERGEADFEWEEVRVYIWRLSQGQAGGSIITDNPPIPEIKYVEIILTEADLGSYETQYLDLGGYKDVTITWHNGLSSGYLGFRWVIKTSDGTYKTVAPILYAQEPGSPNMGPGSREYMGSEYMKVGSKYLEIKIEGWHLNPNEDVIIVVTATK